MAAAHARTASRHMMESPFKDALRLLEDAFAFLKQVDATSWLVYIVGVGPFFAMLLHIINYLSDNPFATDYLVIAALQLAVLYLWMHVCQSVFATRLLGVINLSSPAPLRRVFTRACETQLVMAPFKLAVWPAGLLLVVPHAMVTMFFQSALVLDEASDAGRVWAAAPADSGYARGQSAFVIVLVAFFRAILLLNLYTLVFMAPTLWKAFTGSEGSVTRSPGLLQNPTTFAAVCILSYIGLDPLIKAAVALRHFERRASTSGDDLRLKLLAFTKEIAVLVAVLLVAACAQAQSQRNPPKPITPEQMRSAIQESFRAPSSVWNLPVVRKSNPAGKQRHFFNPLVNLIKGAEEAVDRWMGQLDDFFRKLSSQRDQPSSKKSNSSRGFNSAWVMFALFALALAAAVLWWRRVRTSPAISAAIPSGKTSLPIDLESSSLRADEHSGDEWLEMARRYRAEGNLRFALRALYLSILSALARQSLISIARGKSNLDYLREFQRRGKRLHPEVLHSFQTGLLTFEKSWYGTHTVSTELLDEYEAQASLIQSGAVFNAQTSN